MRNYTTTIAAQKTLAEIQQLLAEYGATEMTTQWDQGRVTGLAFVIATPHGQRNIELPVDISGMRAALIKARQDRKISISADKSRDYAQAERVAWRVLKDWLDAQLSLVAAQMASIDQVMLPYLRMNDGGRTLYEAYREHESALAIAAPGGD